MRRRILQLLAPLLLLGCHRERGPELRVRMDSTAFGRDSTGTARATFTLTNVGTGGAYLEGCDGQPLAFFADRYTGGWSEYLSSGITCVAVFLPQRQVIWSGGSAHGTFSWDEPGTWRLRVLYGDAPENADAYLATSVAFQVR